MSYAQKKQLSGNPTLSVIFTVVVVGGLMYAIVTGLAYNVVKKTVQDLKTFDVEEKPPPPEPPPPPPKDMPKVPPPPMTPPPLVRTNVTPPPTITTVTAPPVPPLAPPVIAPPLRPAPPAAAEDTVCRRVAMATSFGPSDYESEDYPPSSLDNNAADWCAFQAHVLTIGLTWPCGRVQVRRRCDR